jgi:hypothetical protein
VAVENAPPVAAVDVLGARMTEALEARAEFFLIALQWPSVDPARPRRE